MSTKKKQPDIDRLQRIAARLLWGNEASVLVGDFLLGQAFKMMVEVGSLRALEIVITSYSIHYTKLYDKALQPIGQFAGDRRALEAGDLLEVTVLPGCERRAEGHERGTIEHVLVTTGVLEILGGDQWIELGVGDAIRFAADVITSYSIHYTKLYDKALVEDAAEHTALTRLRIATGRGPLRSIQTSTQWQARFVPPDVTADDRAAFTQTTASYNFV